MKVIFSLLTLIALTGCSSTKKEDKEHKPAQPNIVMEISEGILHPESALYSPAHESYFISNVASGNPTETKPVGYMSRVSKDAKTITAKWVTGLHAPKGMTIIGDFIYVADVTRVQKISISKAKIVKTMPIKGSKFLNDITKDDNGNVYVSDMLTDELHVIKKDKVSVFLKDPKIFGLNGLYTDGKEHLLAVSWGEQMDPKTFLTQVPGDLTVIPFAKPTAFSHDKNVQGNLDGIAPDKDDNLWISNWITGDIFKMSKQGKAKKMFNLGSGTADLSIVKELNLMVLPQMNQNKVLFIQL